MYALHIHVNTQRSIYSIWTQFNSYLYYTQSWIALINTAYEWTITYSKSANLMANYAKEQFNESSLFMNKYIKRECN